MQAAKFPKSIFKLEYYPTSKSTSKGKRKKESVKRLHHKMFLLIMDQKVVLLKMSDPEIEIKETT